MDIKLGPDIVTPLEEDRATATGDLHTKFREDWGCAPRGL